MVNLTLFEDSGWMRLLPLTWVRAAFEIRVGRDTLRESIETQLGIRVSGTLTRRVIEPVIRSRVKLEPLRDALPTCLWNARAIPEKAMQPPPVGVAWIRGGALVAAVFPPGASTGGARDALLDQCDDTLSPPLEISPRVASLLVGLQIVEAPNEVRLIDFAWQPALLNGAALRRQLRDGGQHAGRVYPGAHLLNLSSVCIGENAVIKPGCVLDAESGPIEIGADAVVQPNAVIEGPCYIGRGAVIRPGAAIRSDTTIGELCKVGGEIEASIFHGYCNKQHDGFVGHSYVCPWVNLGADTVTSDLKNTYGTIRVSPFGREIESGQHFVGSLIGDHAKTGIGTMLTTGCVVGVGANLFTTGFTPKFVPSFSWLSERGIEPGRVDKIIEIARTVMRRRKMELTVEEEQLLRDVAAATGRIEKC